MPENASVFQIWQLAPESVPGTPLAATDIIRDFGIMLTPQVPNTPIQPLGTVWPTGVLYGKEHTEGSVDGSLGYESLTYILDSLLHVTTPTTPTAAGVYTLGLGAASAGTFTLTFQGQTTAGIAYNAAAAAIDTALEALSTIGVGNVVVTGTTLPTGPITITFAGALAGTGLPLTGSGAGLTGGAFSLTPASAPTLARDRIWTPAQSSPGDTFQTYTIERGSAITADRVAFAQWVSLEVNYTRENVTIGGNLIGQRLEANFGSLAASPTEVAVKPVNSPEVTVYMGNSYLTMARMARPFEARLSITNRVGPVFTLNDAAPSYAATVQLPAEAVLTLTTEHDTDTDDFLTDMRNGQAKAVRIEAVGPTIETGYPYRMSFTLPAARLRNPGRTDNQGAYASSWELFGCYASNYFGTRDGAIEAQLRNSLATL